MNSFTNTEDGIINMAYYEYYAGDKKKKYCLDQLEDQYREIVKMMSKRSKDSSSFLKLKEANEKISLKLE